MGITRFSRVAAALLGVVAIGLATAGAAFAGDSPCQHGSQYVRSQNRNCYTGTRPSGNTNFASFRYTHHWYTNQPDEGVEYGIYVRTPDQVCYETGSQWSCSDNPSHWWKCSSNHTGTANPWSATAYNYPRLVFVGNQSGFNDTFTETSTANPDTTIQGAACDPYP